MDKRPYIAVTVASSMVSYLAALIVQETHPLLVCMALLMVTVLAGGFALVATENEK